MGVFSWVFSLGELGMSGLFRSIFGGSSEGPGAFATGAQTFARAKGGFDRGMHAFLTVINVPSKTDYNRLLSKVEVLQGSLVNLNIKVDRILAAQHEMNAHRGEPPDSEN